MAVKIASIINLNPNENEFVILKRIFTGVDFSSAEKIISSLSDKDKKDMREIIQDFNNDDIIQILEKSKRSSDANLKIVSLKKTMLAICDLVYYVEEVNRILNLKRSLEHSS